MSGGIPQLPREISSDGREIWDWAAKLGEQAQRARKIRQLRADLARTGNRCGDCYNWMKSRLCPREANVNGRNRGPSGDAPICGKFIITKTATERRERLTAELSALVANDPVQS
jgi:hypothetical protein